MVSAPAATAPAERQLPPITQLGMLSLSLVVIGVIYLAAYLPHRAPLAPAVGLLATAIAVLAANVILLSRQHEFAWWRFYQVARWALLAYIIIAGMLEYTFIYDRTRGSLLVTMTLMLVTFTLNVPILLAFTVARFQVSDSSEALDAH
jgi:hypothetical protein